GAGGWLLRGQDLFTDFQYSVPHAECVFFGPRHAALVSSGYNGQGITNTVNLNRAVLTDSVISQIPGRSEETSAPPGGSSTNSTARDTQLGLIDKFTFQAMTGAGVRPADSTNDFEFIRRATLDLTGRIPTPDAVLSFVGSTDPKKRVN